MWVLVLIYAYNAASMTVVPGNYTTQEKCVEAGEGFIRDTSGVFQLPKYSCIIAPDDIIYE